jgi:hypothetical protein
MKLQPGCDFKRRTGDNGRHRKGGPISLRQVRRELAAAIVEIQSLKQLREIANGTAAQAEKFDAGRGIPAGD